MRSSRASSDRSASGRQSRTRATSRTIRGIGLLGQLDERLAEHLEGAGEPGRAELGAERRGPLEVGGRAGAGRAPS